VHELHEAKILAVQDGRRQSTAHETEIADLTFELRSRSKEERPSHATVTEQEERGTSNHGREQCLRGEPRTLELDCSRDAGMAA